jgi:hypothetical protein
MNTGRIVKGKVNWTKPSKHENVSKNFASSKSRNEELTQIRSM